MRWVRNALQESSFPRLVSDQAGWKSMNGTTQSIMERWAAIRKRVSNSLFAQVLRQTARDAGTDHLTQWAAAVAYYGLLSIFPLLLATVAIAANFVEPNWAVRTATELLGEYLPRGNNLVRTTVEEVVEARGAVGLVSLILLLWSGSRVFGTLTIALNIAFDADETYGYLQRILVELGMLLSLGLLFLLSIVLGLGLEVAQRAMSWLPLVQGTAFEWIKAILPSLLLFTTFALTYRFVPRRRPSWRPALAGAVGATLLLLLARGLFLYYLDQFARYSLIYGSLSVVIGLLVWAWLAALILLLGAEFAAHLQMMCVEGRPVREVERTHQERAPDRSNSSS